MKMSLREMRGLAILVIGGQIQQKQEQNGRIDKTREPSKTPEKLQGEHILGNSERRKHDFEGDSLRSGEHTCL